MLRTRTVIYKSVFNITTGGLDRFSQSRSRKAIIEQLTNHSALIAYAYVGIKLGYVHVQYQGTRWCGKLLFLYL